MYAEENSRFAEAINVSSSVFSTPSVALELPSPLAENEAATASFMFAANLLSRIFGKLYLVAPDAALGPNPWQLGRIGELATELQESSEGFVEFRRPDDVDIAVGVGQPPTVPAKFATFFSFSGWNAALESSLDNAGSGTCLGGLFAACYGAAQAFIHSARMFGAEHRPIPPFTLSLLNYDQVGVVPSVDPGPIDINAHLVGVGAVGSAMVYCLGHIPAARGRLLLFDNDYVDSTNLNRYVLMRRRDAVSLSSDDARGRAKVDVAVDALRHTSIRTEPHATTFEDYRRLHTDDPIELLLTPVDSEAGRRKLASYIPRRVLNAATGHSKVTISRHGFADGKACLRCLYLPPNDVKTTERHIADGLGLDVDEVETYLGTNRPLDTSTVRRIEKYRGFVEGALEGFVGQHVQSIYQRAVCGEAAIKTGGGVIVSPLSFISAAGGVMLAAELVKASAPEVEPYLLDNYFRIDTMMRPNPSVRCIKPQSQENRCICEEDIYVSLYRKRYGIAAACQA